MKATKNGLAIQITTDENEKQKEKLAADQFFSSLLGFLAALQTGARSNGRSGEVRLRGLSLAL
jgi:hypothetical protein